MADPLQPSQSGGHNAFDEKLDRLAKKPDVKACIAIDRKNGAILKTSGDLSALRAANGRDAAVAASLPNDTLAQGSESEGIDEFAAIIWSFVNSAGQLVHQMNAEDDVRHLRLRTRNQEITIVLDAKYLLAVILHAPPA